MFSQDYYKNMFISKYDEIERCHNNLTNFSLINVTPALRFMLFDSQPLLDILNRDKHLPIIFYVNNAINFDETEIATSMMLWKEVSFNPLDEYKLLKKDAFLKWPCVYYIGQSITILDVIKFYAYVRGGIHLDKGEAEYQLLREAFEIIKIDQLSTLDHTMRGILQVIYKTLSVNKEKLLS
ncbi:hypothetical protein [Ferruginibacter profundus]|nr:hypothetical protein [Bacteroidota bacterium]